MEGDQIAAKSGEKRVRIPAPAPGSVTARAKKAASTANGIGISSLLSAPIEEAPSHAPRQTTAQTSAYLRPAWQRQGLCPEARTPDPPAIARQPASGPTSPPVSSTPEETCSTSSRQKERTAASAASASVSPPASPEPGCSPELASAPSRLELDSERERAASSTAHGCGSRNAFTK